MALERAYYVGTGYLTREASDATHVAVSLGDVAVVAAEWWDGTEPVIALYATSGLLCALPWPEGVPDDEPSAGVRWFLRAAADITARAPW